MFPLELIALFKKSHLLNPSLVSSLDEQFQTPHRSFCLLLKDRDRKVFCWVILIFIFNGKEFRRVFFIILFEHLHYIFCWAFPYVTQGWQVQAVKHNPLHQINYPTPRSSYNYWHRPSYTSESQKIFLTLLLSLFCILTCITWKHFQNSFQNSLHSYCQTALHFPALKKKSQEFLFLCLQDRNSCNDFTDKSMPFPTELFHFFSVLRKIRTISQWALGNELMKMHRADSMRKSLWLYISGGSKWSYLLLCEQWE